MEGAAGANTAQEQTAWVLPTHLNSTGELEIFTLVKCNVLFNCNHVKLKYTMVTIEKDILHVAQNPEHHSHAQFYEWG
jgi:hypothetical protein